MESKLIRTSLLAAALGSLALAQNQNPYPSQSQQPGPQYQDQYQDQAPPPPASSSSDGAWRRFGDGPNPQPQQAPQPNPQQTNQQQLSQQPAYQQPPQQQYPPQQQGGFSGGYSSTVPAQMQPPPVPSSLTIPSGTWLTIRTTNTISTERNQAGDSFSAILTQPVVVNGLVVARRGQIVQGRVSSAEKAGRVSGTSKLGLEITELVLADGQQVTLHSQMMQRNGNTSYGRDAVGIGTVTAAGAAIGAAVNGGVGAGVGAGAGLVASTLGVLLTRGRPAVVYPETVLTFRVQDSISFSTANSSYAFRPVDPRDYETNPRRLVSSAPPQDRPGYGYGAPYPYAAPYYAPFYGYGYGPSFFFYGGGRGYRRW